MADLRTQIGMYMKPEDIVRYERALKNMEKRIQRSKDDLPRLQATDYVHLLHKNIMGQRHMSGYASYSERYEEWKEKVGMLSKGYWRLFDQLVNNLAVWRVLSGVAGQRAWKGGIPEHAVDKGGTSWYGSGDKGPRKSIAMYARTIEFGEGPNEGKPRPIFVPTKKEYEQKGFVERGEKELKLIAREWK